MTGRPINESRVLAILSGDKTYTGIAHSKCGTTERYVKGGSCVHCARVIAAEQREARRYLSTVNQASNETLDDGGDVELDAAARFEADIESLM